MLARFAFLCCFLCTACVASAGQWSVTPRGALTLNVGSVTGVDELSGVTYIGPAAGDMHRFLSAQDTGNQLVTIDVALAANASVTSATAISSTTLSPGFDFEGVVYNGAARNSVYVSEEITPGVREYDLGTGAQLTSLTIPSVYANRRANRGFESLARSTATGVIWTANEEALTIDGPTATTTAGTYVRIQQFVDAGGTPMAAAQFAYLVDPIHAGTLTASTRSGLSELVSLPDGNLLALERSLATTGFQNRIYQIDFSGATDTSASQFDSGLHGQSFTPVAKSLLWSGQAGGFFGENLEGLALGPQLASGNWSLLGVVDSGDPLSGNTVVAFELVPPRCDLAGDYNCSGEVDDTDYQVWQAAFGSTQPSLADGNDDGVVNAADYTVWSDHLAATNASATAVPEPSITMMSTTLVLLIWRNKKAAALR
jgi:hypothetical protein